ncbi:cysteine protease family C01A [Achlya hypogyna]|uniref:Cysteine protease family C01A n=1 Tax=Achlya hypogyna TaxID=1202772 RepID=A0A1V9YDD2_ACHHY|nr:cysteine protease family C01A [Achlya hypogyna]
MKLNAFTALFFAATANAITFDDLSAEEQRALTAELDEWKASEDGQVALARGLIPKPSKLEAAGELSQVERFFASKQAVERLRLEQPHATFSVNHPFALLTPEEFADMVRGSFEQSQKLREGVEVETRQLAAEAKDSVDWTTHKCLPEVRNQGKCGSCYAFAAVAVAEFAHCLNTGEKVDIAVQQLVSCDRSSGGGCDGGSARSAMDTLARSPMCLAADYPYTSGTTKVNGECASAKCPVKKELKIGMAVRTSGEGNLVASLQQRPTAVTVEAGNDAWRHYSGGVVTSCPGARSDHAVLAVAYGVENGIPFYKIKNSWGANWGDKGYIKLQRDAKNTYSGMCNVGEGPMYHRPRK